MAAKKLNKSAWIRSQPDALPAAQVVAKAKKEGIKLSVSQVYTARGGVKKASSPGLPMTVTPSGRAGASNGIEDLIRSIVRQEIKAFFSER